MKVSEKLKKFSTCAEIYKTEDVEKYVSEYTFYVYGKMAIFWNIEWDLTNNVDDLNRYIAATYEYNDPLCLKLISLLSSNWRFLWKREDFVLGLRYNVWKAIRINEGLLKDPVFIMKNALLFDGGINMAVEVLFNYADIEEVIFRNSQLFIEFMEMYLKKGNHILYEQMNTLLNASIYCDIEDEERYFFVLNALRRAHNI